MCIIAKPQKKKGAKLLGRVEALLREAGRAVEIAYTDGPHGGSAVARALYARGERELIVFGGDGMLNDVLSGIPDPAQVRLGLIPAGTGNDFAAAAGIPYGERAVPLILSGRALPTDYIAFSDGRRSINIAGLGIDVDILERCDRMNKRLGRMSYFVSLLCALMRYRCIPVTLEYEGERRKERVLIAAVCNGRQLGGGIPLCPAARIDDGILELVWVEDPGRRHLLGALIRLMRGKLFDLPIAHRVRCGKALILPQAEGEQTAQYDGELYRTAALNASLVAQGIGVYRPDREEA